MYLDTFNKKECTGCTACANICVHKAISMEMDLEGFKYPIINQDLCINCGLCRISCPVSAPDYSNNDNPLVFASYLKDDNQRKKSSSGGLFYAIARKVIADGGVVYGSVIDADCKVFHKYVEKNDDLDSLRGSKYVQSDIGNCFETVKQQLISGRKVYFVGTPCQVAGLKKFLRRDYDNLLTSDLVCHGVPSQKLLDKHIAYQEKKYKSKIVRIQFRDNSSWGGCEILEFEKKKSIITPTYFFSPYLYSFMYAYTYRYSCYDCKFSKIPRQGDITLGDYWGIKHFFPDLDTSCGVSVIIVNSLKGQAIWEDISEESVFKVSNIENAKQYNGNIVGISEMPCIRPEIYNLIEKNGYESIANSLFKTKNHTYKRIRYTIINLIRKSMNLLKNNIKNIKSL